MATKKIADTISKLRADILSGRLVHGSMLPAEKELAAEMKLSRPTVAKVYNTLKNEGLLKKTPGQGTVVVFNGEKSKYSFGLLLPGAGESEIFGIIHDHFLAIEKEKGVKFLWEGAIANNAQVRENTILKTSQQYVEKNVSGVFFAPLERTANAASINHEICDLFDNAKIPLILIDRDIYQFPLRSNYNVVGLDNFNAGYVMTKHLIDNGADAIYFFYRKDSASSINKRIAGCNSACFELDITFGKEQIIIFEDHADPEFLKKLKKIPKRAGILRGNDSTAAVVMAAFKQIGVQIGKDILIAGYDDMKYGKLLQPPLTTFRQPLMEIATISYEMMMNTIVTSHQISADINFSGELIERESSKFH